MVWTLLQQGKAGRYVLHTHERIRWQWLYAHRIDALKNYKRLIGEALDARRTAFNLQGRKGLLMADAFSVRHLVLSLPPFKNLGATGQILLSSNILAQTRMWRTSWRLSITPNLLHWMGVWMEGSPFRLALDRLTVLRPMTMQIPERARPLRWVISPHFKKTIGSWPTLWDLWLFFSLTNSWVTLPKVKL